MSPALKKNIKKKQRKQIFRKWHRRMGFAASVFLLNLAVTGILLNHYEALDLHKSYVKSEWLLDWYNVKAPQTAQCFTPNDKRLCQIDNMIFDYKQLSQSQAQLELLLKNSQKIVNVFDANETIYLVTANKLFLFNHELLLIESIDFSETIKQTVVAANLIDDTVFFFSENHVFVFEEDSSEVIAVTDLPENPESSENLDIQPLINLSPLLTTQQKLRLQQAYRGQQISHLKVVQDLHSGQILSISGKLINDLSAIIVILLAVSGFITWQRRKNPPK